MKTPLVVVTGSERSDPGPDPSADRAPRPDYIELSRLVGATVLAPDQLAPVWRRLSRRIERGIALDLIGALVVARRARDHSCVVSTSERIAIPVAALARMIPTAPPHIVVAHKLSSGYKTRLFRLWPLQRRFARVVCNCRPLAEYAVRVMGMPASRVDFVRAGVDERFFRPLDSETGDYVLAVGQEVRDYASLVQAMAGTDIKLVVVASSPWSRSPAETAPNASVSVRSGVSYRELRSLYAGARLVVVPLRAVDYAAGITALLEAMAMAKAVVVSATAAVADYVSDDQTARAVAPGDWRALREAVRSLWDDRARLRELGANARQAVMEGMRLDDYVARLAGIVRDATGVRSGEALARSAEAGSESVLARGRG